MKLPVEFRIIPGSFTASSQECKMLQVWNYKIQAYKTDNPTITYLTVESIETLKNSNTQHNFSNGAYEEVNGAIIYCVQHVNTVVLINSFVCGLLFPKDCTVQHEIDFISNNLFKAVLADFRTIKKQNTRSL
jgi:hypothetical protein